MCFEIICIRHSLIHSQKFRYHPNKTFSSDACLIRMKMSYSHDFEHFESNCMARKMSYSRDRETIETSIESPQSLMIRPKLKTSFNIVGLQITV